MTRVLVVEDSPTQAKKLALMLATHGFEVEVARDGIEGLDALRRAPFDIVLSDVMMPGLDGYELCRRAKANPQTANTPFVLLTSLSEPMDIIRGLECGADNFITKPYDVDYLFERVQRLIEQRKLRLNRKVAVGVELLIMGNRLTITSEKEQIVDLLISTFEEMLRTRKREHEAQVRMEALRESELLLQSALDALSAAIAIVDANGRIVAVNRAWRRFAELGKWPWPAAGVGMEYVEIWKSAFDAPPEYGREVECGVQELLEGTRERLTVEYPARSNGEQRWYAVCATPFEGRHPKMLAIQLEDVTARRHAEEQLRASEERFRALAHSASDAIVTTDEDGRILFFNDAATRTFARSDREVIGTSLRELIDKPAARELAAYFEAGKNSGQPQSRVLETEGRRTDGSRFPLELSLGTWTLHGKTYRTYILRDVTQRRQLEIELRQAQKMEGIGHLAGGVAHDFNNVLAAIKSCAELAISEASPEPSHAQELTEIVQAAERGTALTRQLLAFSRKQVLRPIVCDLNRIVTDFDRMLRRVIGRDVDLLCKLDPRLARVKVDPGQIEQVLMNLAVNARDAMPSGGKLTISTYNIQVEEPFLEARVRVAPGRYVVLAVSDSGVGMDKAVQVRIFEPFFTTKERGKGTGLGLSTVYGIVRQSGGHIFVYSELGQGTSFKIYLPESQESFEEVPRPTIKPRVHSSGGETILLVEDDPALRRITARILNRTGYRVLVAEDPRVALNIAASNRDSIELLLTDVVMPEMSGTELAAHLRQARPDLKVLFMSGYAGTAIARHGAIPAGAQFLEKPFGPDSLARKVQAVLNEIRSDEASSAGAAM